MSIRRIYKDLSRESRGHFWVITTNCLVVLVTFWMGITIQYMVYNIGAERQGQLMHYQIIDKIYPMYQKVRQSSGVLIGRMSQYVPEEDAPNEIQKFVKENTEQIVEVAKQSIPIMDKAVYYVNEANADSIQKNVVQMKIMLKLIQWTSCAEYMEDEQIQDSIRLFIAGEELFLNGLPDGFRENIFEVVKKGRKLPKGVAMVAAQHMTIPIVKNYKILRDEIFSYTTVDSITKKILMYAIGIFFGSCAVIFLIWMFLFRLAFGKRRCS